MTRSPVAYNWPITLRVRRSARTARAVRRRPGRRRGSAHRGTGGNPERLGREASFAALCGVNPISASSGKTTRHRLNRGSDRQATQPLHTVALVRMRSDPRTRAYVARRTTEGLSRRENHAMHQALHRPRAPLAHPRQPADLPNIEASVDGTDPRSGGRRGGGGRSAIGHRADMGPAMCRRGELPTAGRRRMPSASLEACADARLVAVRVR